jgi:hypothetical protein
MHYLAGVLERVLPGKSIKLINSTGPHGFQRHSFSIPEGLLEAAEDARTTARAAMPPTQSLWIQKALIYHVPRDGNELCGDYLGGSKLPKFAGRI